MLPGNSGPDRDQAGALFFLVASRTRACFGRGSVCSLAVRGWCLSSRCDPRCFSDGESNQSCDNAHGFHVTLCSTPVSGFWRNGRAAVLSKIPLSNCCKRVPNRPLWPRGRRFGALLQQLECGSFGRTADGRGLTGDGAVLAHSFPALPFPGPPSPRNSTPSAQFSAMRSVQPCTVLNHAPNRGGFRRKREGQDKGLMQLSSSWYSAARTGTAQLGGLS